MGEKSQSKTVLFDIETNGLWHDVNTFHVGVTLCLETKKIKRFRDADEMVAELNTSTEIVGHNIINYDIPVLNRLADSIIDHNITVTDTLILGKLAYYDQDRSFKYSLDAFGERLGFKKGSHSDWSKYSKEMEEYCVQDVLVTQKLFTHLKRKTPWLPREALDLEQDVQRIISTQEKKGWQFDTKKAERLHIELTQELEQAKEALERVFVPLLLPHGKARTPKRPFRRLGVTTIGENQPIKLTSFNPSSGKHIVWWVELLYGEMDWRYTDKGGEKTDGDTLKAMFSEYDWAEPLLHYLEVKKLLGQLAEGPKAWLKEVKSDGRIYGSADILGAVTGRFTHSNPNLAQVPSSSAYKGREARSLFTVKKGYKLVGADASGLELRTLSHYLARHDNGKYGDTVLEGDIHTANQTSAGLPTRDMAKTFIYGFLYGAGDAKIGEIVKGGQKEGALLKRRFLAKTTGLSALVEGVKRAAKRGYLIGLSGRRLYVRSPHSALNTLLQSAGAYYMKYWLVEIEKRLENFDASFVGNIHDEVQVEVREDQAEEVAKILEDAFIDVGEAIGMRIKMEGEAQIGNTWEDTH
jgi:DNA polymerase I-like protein with 3'-5' exonuclease and polymerase domains